MNVFLLVIFLYFAVFALLIFVMICGNNKNLRNTFIGSMYRFLTIVLPGKISGFGKRCCPKCCGDHEECLGSKSKFRGAIALFFYFIYSAFVIIYFVYGYNEIDEAFSNPRLHRFLAWAVLPWPWVIFLIFQFADPGVITKENVQEYLEIYPYDNVIYTPKECPTDHIPVVPRSRYCRFTNRRIAKYDHYCPWVMASIGARTHRLFVLFLISCLVASSYYCYAAFSVLKETVLRVGRRVRWTDSTMENFARVIMIVMSVKPFLAGSFIALFVIVITLLFFLGQVVYLVSKNMTQIERDKIEMEKERRKEEGITEPFVNMYDKGFINNWKELIFPPKPCKRHAKIKGARRHK